MSNMSVDKARGVILSVAQKHDPKTSTIYNSALQLNQPKKSPAINVPSYYEDVINYSKTLKRSEYVWIKTALLSLINRDYNIIDKDWKYDKTEESKGITLEAFETRKNLYLKTFKDLHNKC